MPSEALTKNLAKLDKLLTLMDEDGLTRAEFTDAFQKVIDLVTKVQDDQAKAIANLERTYQLLLNKMQNDHSTTLAGMRKEVDKLFVGTRMEKMEKMHGEMMKMADMKVKSLKHGQDGMPGPRGERGPSGSSDTPEMVRQKLEQAGINAKAIEGLKEEVKRLTKEIIGNVRFGGASNYGRIATRFISEAPSGTPDGSNKLFYLSAIAAAGSLILQVNGQLQRPGSSNEYTLVDRTITFTDANKPQTGDTLWAFYSKL